jgi:hypothetical protein
LILDGFLTLACYYQAKRLELEMKKQYYAWMLRINPISNGEDWTWRISLEDPRTRDRVGFDSLEAFITFIQDSLEREHPKLDQKPWRAPPNAT